MYTDWHFPLLVCTVRNQVIKLSLQAITKIQVIYLPPDLAHVECNTFCISKDLMIFTIVNQGRTIAYEGYKFKHANRLVSLTLWLLTCFHLSCVFPVKAL